VGLKRVRCRPLFPQRVPTISHLSRHFLAFLILHPHPYASAQQDKLKADFSPLSAAAALAKGPFTCGLRDQCGPLSSLFWEPWHAVWHWPEEPRLLPQLQVALVTLHSAQTAVEPAPLSAGGQ
jgi:hypothetical protein